MEKESVLEAVYGLFLQEGIRDMRMRTIHRRHRLLSGCDRCGQRRAAPAAETAALGFPAVRRRGIPVRHGVFRFAGAVFLAGFQDRKPASRRGFACALYRRARFGDRTRLAGDGAGAAADGAILLTGCCLWVKKPGKGSPARVPASLFAMLSAPALRGVVAGKMCERR